MVVTQCVGDSHLDVPYSIHSYNSPCNWSCNGPVVLLWSCNCSGHGFTLRRSTRLARDELTHADVLQSGSAGRAVAGFCVGCRVESEVERLARGGVYGAPNVQSIISFANCPFSSSYFGGGFLS